MQGTGRAAKCLDDAHADFYRLNAATVRPLCFIVKADHAENSL
jgi:hypothetical protein